MNAESGYDYSFEKYLGDLEVDKKGRVKSDPNSGAFIPKNKRRKEAAYITAGADALAKSNFAFDPGYQQDTLKRSGY